MAMNRCVTPSFEGEWSLVCSCDEYEKQPWKREGRMQPNFTKGAKWSPDGTCVLTSSDDKILRLFSLPIEFYDPDKQVASETRRIAPDLRVHEGEIIYDFCWFPLMRAGDIATSCFASTSRDHPVHLYDAFTGQLRCSYSSYNHLDVLVSPLSIAFGHNGARIHCGFDRCIRTFDTSRPGKDCSVLVTQPAKSGPGSLPGQVSSLCPSPDGRLLAAGSYSKSVAVYSVEDGSCICLLSGHSGGVTQVSFSPDGTFLATGARKDNVIFCWDVRNPTKPVHEMTRVVSTNQRIAFCFSPSGRNLITGSTDGSVLVFSLPDGKLVKSIVGLHGDAVNGVDIHPVLPLVVTTTGKRAMQTFSEPDISDSDDDETAAASSSPKKSITPIQPTEDTRMRIWKVPHTWHQISS